MQPILFLVTIHEYVHLSRSRANIPKRAAIDAALLRLAPTIPPHERMAVVDHAVDSRGLSTASSETAAWLSLVAYVRHTFTDYDELLRGGYDADSARHFVAARIDKILQTWGASSPDAPRLTNLALGVGEGEIVALRLVPTFAVART